MADIDGEDLKEYRWETGYEKTWEALGEDDNGMLDSAIAEIIQKAKRKRQANKSRQNRLGMMRHLYVLMDCSESMAIADLKPTRLMCTLKLLENFIDEYFDQNPISQLGVIVLKNKRAEKLTDLSGTSKMHVKALQIFKKINPIGEPSIQNGLDLAMKALKAVPPHASREILIIMASLSTCDPMDINITIDILKKENIRCSVISLSAEIRVCKHLAKQTNGTYSAVLDDAHYRDQLLAHIDPPPATKRQENSLIKMGFPYTRPDDGKYPPLSMCMCHINNIDEPSKLTSTGYHCPQCFSKYCELPVECQTCGLTLVSAPHLARSYHHLFPVKHFSELNVNTTKTKICFGCQKLLHTSIIKTVYRCDLCNEIFCSKCDTFIHDTLHTCVGCSTKSGIMTQVYTRHAQASSSTLNMPNLLGSQR